MKDTKNRGISAYAGSTGRDDGRDSNSWYTPSKYIEAARAALGGIELDPMSSQKANEVVGAAHYYTEEDDALTKEWAADTLFLNPPYSGQMVKQSINYLLDQWEAGQFNSAVVLVNNATETQWFQRMLKESSRVCFTNHRISFWNQDGKPLSGNTRGQAFFLLTRDPKVKREFRHAFSEIGIVLQGGYLHGFLGGKK